MVLLGTVRTLNEGRQAVIHDGLCQTTEQIAASMGEGGAPLSGGIPMALHDPDLTERMVPAFRAAAQNRQIELVHSVTAVEGFSSFRRQAPGLYLLFETLVEAVTPVVARPVHSPQFRIGAGTPKLRVQTHAHLVPAYPLAESDP